MADSTLYSAVQELAARYPSSRSAIMPALHLAQDQHGWLPPDALREVADALDLTPAYVMGVASFYDMYDLAPTGRHRIAVCTNVSCALNGAQGVVEAFEQELGITTGDTTEDGEFSLTTFECLGGCGWATVVALDWRYRERVGADDVPGILAELRGEAPAGGEAGE